MKTKQTKKSDLGELIYQSPRVLTIKLDMIARICNASDDPEPTVTDEVEPAF